MQEGLNPAKVAHSNLRAKFLHTDSFLRMSKVLNSDHESLTMFSIKKKNVRCFPELIPGEVVLCLLFTRPWDAFMHLRFYV